MKHCPQPSPPAPHAPGVLGIECGGTRTVALFVRGQVSERSEWGPANLRLVNDAQLRAHFKAIARAFPRPDALGIGMAGARITADRARISEAAARIWPGAACVATNDLETALAAAPPPEAKKYAAQVLILSGTGSCCYGRNRSGQSARVGGWGHVLGDRGSGYEISLNAARAVVDHFDRTGAWPALGRRFLRHLQLNEPGDLIGWAQGAAKNDIAAAAVEVFSAAAAGDRLAKGILNAAAVSLARDAADCARKLVKGGTRVQFIMAGSGLLKQPAFARAVAARVKKQWPRAGVQPLARESAWGAVEIARREFDIPAAKSRAQSFVPAASPARDFKLETALSPTEQRNPRSRHLDKLSLDRAIRLMLSEEAAVPRAILAERKKIARVITLVAHALGRGGRLFYVGAGTSGRLGILDASECPPTFRTPPEWVQGIIAGGPRAVFAAVEGAEDDADAGGRAVEYRGAGRRDVVVGIAASGRTPFVWGAMDAAKRRGARTVLVCFHPQVRVPTGRRRPDVIISPPTGPEVLTGSTRLKAGTATKIILNLFTTLAMVRLGKVAGNLMVDLNPSNTKLRDRAVRIVGALTGAAPEHAQAALEKSGWVIQRALAGLAK